MEKRGLRSIPGEHRAFDRRRFLQSIAALTAGAVAPAGAVLDSPGRSITAEETLARTPGRADVVRTPAAEGGVTVGGLALRPTAVPLAVRDPYVSAWLNGTDLVGPWASGFSGHVMPICGLVRIDRKAYAWCGTHELLGASVHRMAQVSVAITPTRSIFTFRAGGVELVAEFLSPVEPGNPRLQSVPLTLLTVSVAAIDGRHHTVDLYCDISGQWASWNDDDDIVWSTSETSSRHLAASLASEEIFSERNEMAAWGTAVISSGPTGPHMSFQCGKSSSVRFEFARTGRLSNVMDRRFRPIDVDTPVFAIAHALGRVGQKPVSAHWSVGHFEEPAVEYMGQQLQPLWKTYWDSWQGVVDDFLKDSEAARRRAAALDTRLTEEAERAGGPGYAALCALALRQVYEACQLVTGPSGQKWAFLKEISSDDDMSTVDIIFDACPLWLYLDPDFLPMLLEPILQYSSSSAWTEDFPPHCLGSWPVADGNPTGSHREWMPMWESGAMLVMAASWAGKTTAAGERVHEFLSRYETLWTTWSALLASQLPDPPRQLTTIDYLGASTGNVNLAVLGLVGLGAAADIAGRLGDTTTQSNLAAQAKNLATQWASLATDTAGQHLDAEIGQTGTWSDVCNAFWDASLGTGLVPDSIATAQASWYEAHLHDFGLAVSSEDPLLARVDQQVLTAAWLYDQPVGAKLIESVVRYVNHTSYRAPLPDTYNPRTGGMCDRYNWRARPVVGGVFALLL